MLNKFKNDGLKDTFEAVNNKLNTPIQIGYCNLGVVEESRVGNLNLVIKYYLMDIMQSMFL